MTTASASLPQTSTSAKPSLTAYALVTLALSCWGVVLALAVRGATDQAVADDALLQPIYAQAALTFVVWLMMVLVRNYAVLRDIAPASYYVDFRGSVPSDWVERPARAFNNLMQAPTLFYVVCLLMLQTHRLDGGQVALAWLFFAARAFHAVVFIGWNHVPTRFASWVAGVITLATLWFRFASH